MNPQTPPRPVIKRSLSESTLSLSPDEPRQASKTTEYDSPRSSRLFQAGEPEPFQSRSSGQETIPSPINKQDTTTFDSIVHSSVVNKYPGDDPYLTILRWVAALQTITEMDKCLKTLTTADCLALIHEHPDLRFKLEEAIKIGSYAEIRRLCMWPPSSIHRCFKAKIALN